MHRGGLHPGRPPPIIGSANEKIGGALGSHPSLFLRACGAALAAGGGAEPTLPEKHGFLEGVTSFDE